MCRACHLYVLWMQSSNNWHLDPHKENGNMDQELLYQEGGGVMRTRTKVWLIIATSLVLVGCILFAGVMTTLKWDFMELATVRYETNTYEISEVFDRISMNTDTADIVFVLSDDGNCRVECHEEANAKHSVTVEDGALTIELIDERTVYDFIGYIGLNFDTPKITVYLPKTEYASLHIKESTGDIEIPKDFNFKDVDVSLSTGDVTFNASASELIKIKTSTGDICVENITAGSLDLTVSTGKVTVSGAICEGDVTVGVSTGKAKLIDITCKSVISSGSTGDILLNDVIATEKISIERSTGDVKFDRSDAAEIFVKTDTGDVTGSLLTDKVFITQTDTGDVDVPKTVDGDRCEIITDTGDIKITIKQ